MKSYLSNRYQYVKINDSISSYQSVTCGTPQGSTLGPLLFLMYVNDLPKCSEFTTTLFADDTYLTLSDESLKNLENRANEQLTNIIIWLRSNKLSLNYSKTTYLLINKLPQISVSSEFKLAINQNIIERATSVKCLGVYLDEKLTWSNHLQLLSSQLAKTSGIFYRLREYVTKKTLCMLYYSLVNSRVQYAISVWGTACKSRLQEISVRLNNIVRMITWNNKFAHVTKMYEELKFLKLNEIYQLVLAKFMHQLNYNRLPDVNYDQFTKIEEIHSHDTRQVKKALYFLPRVA